MRHDPKTYLWDIQQAAQRINSLTAETTFDEYNADWKVSLLVEHLFIIIGEAMTRLETHHPDIAQPSSTPMLHMMPKISRQAVDQPLL